MAAKWNVSAQMIILPNTVDMCVWDADGEHSYKQTVSVPHKPISFAINTKLSNLSWLVVENSLPSFDDARKAYQKIIDTTRPVNKWLVMILVMFANASFCRLFGGDFQSMGIVALATLVGYYLKIIMLDAHADMRIVFICCSFVSAVHQLGERHDRQPPSLRVCAIYERRNPDRVYRNRLDWRILNNEY